MSIACSGDGPSEPDTSAISAEHLPSMVLGAEDVAALGTFEMDESTSGVRSTEDIIEESFDTGRDRAELMEFGRVTGYVGNFTQDPNAAPEGIFFLSSVVHLFETVEGAERSLADEVEDAIADVGKSNGAATLLTAEQVQDAGLDDDYPAIRLTLDTSGDGEPDFSNTLVGFTVGRLLGAVSIASVDAEAALTEEAGMLAEMLRDRIVGVVEGDEG